VTAPIASSLFLFADQHRASDDDAIFDLKPHNIYFNPRVWAALSGESPMSLLSWPVTSSHLAVAAASLKRQAKAGGTTALDECRLRFTA
jgi:hypothetical protein